MARDIKSGKIRNFGEIAGSPLHVTCASDSFAQNAARTWVQAETTSPFLLEGPNGRKIAVGSKVVDKTSSETVTGATDPISFYNFKNFSSFKA